MENLQTLDDKLRELTRYESDARPFLCEGTPFGCDIFLVGINPATSTNFWDHWSPQTGCNKKGWINKYLENHNGKLNPTRKRIELFFEYSSPVRVLETNIFPFPSDRENDLDPMYRDTALFDYLVRTIQPKVILGHGASVIKYLSKMYGKDLVKGEFIKVQHGGQSIEVRVENHFSYQWSYNAIKDLAIEIRERYA